MSILQFIGSIFAITGLWGFAFFLIVIGILDTSSPLFDANDSLSLFLMSAGLAASGFLVVPSAVLSLRRILGKKSATSQLWSGRINPGLLIFALPIVLLTGYLVVTYSDLAWIILPPLHVLAVFIPIIWLLYLGTRELPLGSRQRFWGVFDSGLVLAPALVMVLELIAFSALAGLIIFYMLNHPGLSNQIWELMEAMSQVTPTPEALTELIEPYLTSPVIIFAAFVFISILVPLIEEALKPIGVWLLFGRKMSTAAGFAGGLLSGAGFALFESLAMTSSGTEWTVGVVTRIGTAVIHMFTAGLMGWALVNTWTHRKYLRLGGTYLIAVLIHGLWNCLSLFMILTDFSNELDIQLQQPLVSALGSAAPFILILVTIVLFILMLRINANFRSKLKDEQEIILTPAHPGS